MNPIAMELAKRFEGYSEEVYLCPAGIPTAGYGHAFQGGEAPRRLPPPEAEAVLAADMARAERGALANCPVLAVENEGRQAAITDFVFNLGAGRLKYSTLRRRINEGDWDDAVREIGKWVYAGGRKLRGLVLRRAAEAKLMQGGAEI